MTSLPKGSSCSKLWRFDIQNENFASGCFGTILLARDPLLDREVVIKKIPKDGVSSSEVTKEIEAGKILNHKNIAKFNEHFSNNEWDFLVFERVFGYDLFNTIERRKFVPFSDIEGRKIFKQILKAIRYCHSKEVVHRDIKLENILMDNNGKVTVIDFGLCDIVKRGVHSLRFCGSIDYVAPEVLSKNSYDGYLADVFSLGVVLYTLLFAEFPFIANERVNAMKQKKEQPKISFSESKMKRWKINPLAKDLITKMLRTQPEQRLTLEEVKLHPWIRKKPSNTLP